MDKIEKFNPATLMDGVRDRIRSTFISLIPEEAWSQMVKKEIDEFFRLETDGGYRQQNTSNFKRVVFQVLTVEATEKVKSLLQTDPLFTLHASGPNTLSDLLKEEIIKAGPKIFATSIENLVAQTVERMKYT